MNSHFSTTFIAPAGAVSKEAVETASAILSAQGMTVSSGKNIFAGDASGYLSAPLACRVSDLEDAWQSCIDCIWCARGGYGAMAVAAAADWQKLRAHNPSMPLIGYSDITALHMRMLKENTGRPIVAAMTSMLTTKTVHEVAATLANGNTDPYPLHVFNGVFPQKAYITAANLAVLAGMCGTGMIPDMTGRILLLEDINEPLYKLDRYMTQLSLAGILDQPLGIAAGDFHLCGEKEPVYRLLADFAAKHSKPFAGDAPFGHKDAPAIIDLSREITFCFR